MASGPTISWLIDGETMETVRDFIFLGSNITADGDCSHEIKRCLLLERKAVTNLDSILKNRDITLPTKVCLVKVMVFPVFTYGCDSWTIVWVPKNWCIWTVVLKKTLESSLDGTEVKQVTPKGNQPWIFTWRTDDATEAIIWPPDSKNWLIRKDSDSGKNWRQEEKGMIEDEMDGWHHWFNGHEFEQALGHCKDREGCLAAVHGVAKSQTRLWLNNYKFQDRCLSQFLALFLFLLSMISHYWNAQKANNICINESTRNEIWVEYDHCNL